MSVTFVLGLSLVLLLVIFAVSAVLHGWQRRNRTLQAQLTARRMKSNLRFLGQIKHLRRSKNQ